MMNSLLLIRANAALCFIILIGATAWMGVHEVRNNSAEKLKQAEIAITSSVENSTRLLNGYVLMRQVASNYIPHDPTDISILFEDNPLFKGVSRAYIHQDTYAGNIITDYAIRILNVFEQYESKALYKYEVERTELMLTMGADSFLIKLEGSNDLVVASKILSIIDNFGRTTFESVLIYLDIESVALKYGASHINISLPLLPLLPLSKNQDFEPSFKYSAFDGVGVKTVHSFSNGDFNLDMELSRHITLADINIWAFIAFSLLIIIAYFITTTQLRNEKSIKAQRQAVISGKLKKNVFSNMVMDNINEAVVAIDSNYHVIFMNNAANQMSGFTDKEAIGTPVKDIFPLAYETTGELINCPANYIFEGPCDDCSGISVLKNKHNEVFLIESNPALMRDNNDNVIGASIFFKDVTVMRRLTKHLEDQAKFDYLTGLYNRRYFESELDSLVFDARNGESHALCILDLDRFKVVNDSAGHQAGDQLLKDISAIITETVRESDKVARIGGDEFAVLMFDCPLMQSKIISNNIVEKIRGYKFTYDNHTFNNVNASAGLLHIKGNTAVDFKEAMMMADSACGVAKKKGRDQVQVYTPSDVDIAKNSTDTYWYTRVINALTRDQFSLHLQEISSVSKSARCGGTHYEVLVRMKDHDGKLVPPNTFIPAIERYDISHSLDEWVISKTFSLINDCRAAISDDTLFNINLSGASLTNDSILEIIKEGLDKANFPGHMICFEITETDVVKNFSQAKIFIKTLREYGCLFALDDFGTGYSSFSYLKNLDVNFLKIDGHFIKDINSNNIDKYFVEAINKIAHFLELETIGEYVEDENTLNTLIELGIDYAQGFHITKSRPWEEVISIHNVHSDDNDIDLTGAA